MRDLGIDKGLVQERDDSLKTQKGFSKGFFGFRKMFRDYLTKLNVAFYDACCPELTGDSFPMRFNGISEEAEYFNGTSWVPAASGGDVIQGSMIVDDSLNAGSPQASDSGTVFTNSGGIGTRFVDLPPAQPGLVFTFIQSSDQTMQVSVASGSDRIWLGDQQNSLFIESTAEGDSITLLAVTSTQWRPISQIGTWVFG